MTTFFVMESTNDADGFSSVRRYAFFTGKNGKQFAEDFAAIKNKNTGINQDALAEYRFLMDAWVMNNPIPEDVNETPSWMRSVKQESLRLRNELGLISLDSNADMCYYYVDC